MQSLIIYDSSILTCIDSGELVSNRDSAVEKLLAVGYKHIIICDEDSLATHLPFATDNDTAVRVSHEDSSKLDLDDIESVRNVGITLENLDAIL